MRPESLVHQAVRLPWLRPGTTALLALTEDSPPTPQLLANPAIALHLLRFLRPTPLSQNWQIPDTAFHQPSLTDLAADLLETAPNQFAFSVQSPWCQFGQRCATVARSLAENTQFCSPDAAYLTALLWPMAHYAMASVSLKLPALDDWGASPIQLTRRLLHRWRLPVWLQIGLGFPELKFCDLAQLPGIDLDLVRVVRSAVAWVGQSNVIPYVGYFAPAETDAELDRIVREYDPSWQSPHLSESESDDSSAGIWLPRLLRMATKARGRSGAAWMDTLESQIDHLSGTLAEARFDQASQLQREKINAMAEFAAGAGHEINNPLAVIAGNVQLLRKREQDPEKQNYLSSIHRQTKRIHEILLGIRQFSRPPKAHRAPYSLERLWQSLANQWQAEAQSQNIRLEFPDDALGLAIFVDAEQIHTIFSHLLRNALSAAGKGGWVRLSWAVVHQRVLITLEDSGSGPSPQAVPHLFDPFFSGHSAGRGRGLGLSIAWRLAEVNGGELVYHPIAGHPSRFVLSLEVSYTQSQSPAEHRMSA